MMATAGGPSVSAKGNGVRLVDAIAISDTKDLRVFLNYHGWVPESISLRAHQNSHDSEEMPPSSFAFRAIVVPLDKIDDLRQLLARAIDCARQPLNGTPYAEED